MQRSMQSQLCAQSAQGIHDSLWRIFKPLGRLILRVQY